MWELVWAEEQHLRRKHIQNIITTKAHFVSYKRRSIKGTNEKSHPWHCCWGGKHRVCYHLALKIGRKDDFHTYFSGEKKEKCIRQFSKKSKYKTIQNPIFYKDLVNFPETWKDSYFHIIINYFNIRYFQSQNKLLFISMHRLKLLHNCFFHK